MAVSLAFSSFSQPVNDSCSNPIVLSGHDISFSGDLTGATRETAIGEGSSPGMGDTTQTLWWEWTPDVSGVAILIITNASKPQQSQDGVVIWSLRETSPFFSADYLTALRFDDRLPHWIITFNALVSTNYHIQLQGSDSANFGFHLIATNTPHVIESPQSQTVTHGDSVMFGVIAAGAKPFAYQWVRNGTNLPGETYPTLRLPDVTTNEAGQYRVNIINSGGVSISETATLAVTSTDTTSTLIALPWAGSNMFSFNLQGEVGRRYRIESSTNLTDWAPEASFQTKFLTPDNFFNLTFEPKSVVFNATGMESFGVPVDQLVKFYRAAAFHAVNEECNMNRKMYRYAQLLAAYDNNWPADMYVVTSDLVPYVKPSSEPWWTSYHIPSCPDGGNYLLSYVNGNIFCSLHPFEER